MKQSVFLSGAWLFGAIAVGCVAREDVPVVQHPAQAKAGSVIDGYRGWTKVNTKPHRVAAAPSGLCIASVASHQRVLDTPDSGNQDFYVTVFVNDKGQKAMFAKGAPDFPTGSVIVKEKLLSADDTKPRLLTVMVKKGSAPADWKYLAFDGDGRPIADAASSGNCRSCHEIQKSSGYVFRSYLPR